MQSTPAPTHSIDSLISRQLPVWMTTASADHLHTLRRSVVAQQLSQHHWQEVVSRIAPLDRFAAPLLAAALQALTGAQIDVRVARLHRVRNIPVPPYVAGVPAGFVAETSQQSLLAAALHNFSSAETQEESYGADSRLLDASGTVLDLSPAAFADLCRTLDLGGKYRAHLQAVLAPPLEEDRVKLRAVVEQAQQGAMDAAVRVAMLKGELDERSYRQLLPLAAARPIVPSDDARVLALDIRLFGKQVVGVVAVEVINALSSALEGVIVWIPDDPLGPVTRYGSWALLFEALGERLRKPDYAVFFQRFIAERDRTSFMEALSHQLKHTTGSLELDGRHFPIEGPVFEHLRKRQLDKIHDDARVLAVPTDDEDRDERDRRLKSYLNLGLEVVGLAAFFVPGLGLPLLGLAALQVADQIYEGYHDWQLGDREAALGHVFEVAQTVVSVAVIGGVGVAAESLVERVPYVDELTPVRTATGELRLSADRGPEQARYWSGAGNLLRSLDNALAEVEQPVAERLLATTGLDEHQVRRLHLEQEAAPARLLDALQRDRLHEERPGVRGAAFEAELAESWPPPSDTARILLRDFPGLSLRCAEEIIARANGKQLQTLTEESRVPLALAEQARWALRDSRVDRAVAGLRQPSAMNRDGEVLVLKLLDQWQPWPETVRVEVCEGTADGAVVAHTRSSAATRVKRIVRGSEGYTAVDGEGAALPMSASADDLTQAVWLCLEDAQKARMGDRAQSPQALAQALAARAARQRGDVPGLLGMAPVSNGVRPPVRLGDGRLGYPLSGRGESSLEAIRRGLAKLFPTYTEAELQRYIDSHVSRGIDLWQQYSSLQGRLDSLKASLDAWQGEPVGLFRGLRRRAVVKLIRRAWRRKSRDARGNFVLKIEGDDVGALPLIAPQVDFSHITHLTLRGMRLTSLDQGWLRNFSGVTNLDLRDNHLSALPAALEHLPLLTVLRLDDNLIVLDVEANRRLASLTQLVELGLSNNPLRLAPSVDHLLRLRRLSLRSTQMEDLPTQVLNHPRLENVDLRDNRIQVIPEALLEGPRGRLRRLAVHDNPLDPASIERLRQFLATDNLSPWRPFRHVDPDDAVRDRWVRGDDQDVLFTQRQDWAQLRAEEGSADFFRFLADLSESGEYQYEAEALRARVHNIIETCVQNGEVREAVFQLTSEPRGCIDQLLLMLSTIEVRVQVVQQTAGLDGRGAERALLSLGRSLFRLDEVNRIAAQRIVDLKDTGLYQVDDVEVYLAYRTGLADALKLPAQPRYMYFGQFSMVGKSELNAAKQAVLRAETLATLSRSLAERDFWIKFLQDTQPEAFDATNKPFHEQLEVLAEEAATLGDQVYLQRADEQAQARAAAERALIFRLTQRAYDRHPDA